MKMKIEDKLEMKEEIEETFKDREVEVYIATGITSIRMKGKVKKIFSVSGGKFIIQFEEDNLGELRLEAEEVRFAYMSFREEVLEFKEGYMENIGSDNNENV